MQTQKTWHIPGLSNAHTLNALGDALYPKVRALAPKTAGKITGMLLVSFSVADLDALLENEVAFVETVRRAEQVLAAAAAK